MPGRQVHLISSAVVMLLLAGCAIVPGPRGTGSGRISPGSAIAIAQSGNVAGAIQFAAIDAVRQVMLGQGYQISSQANLIADVGFAVRERSVGFSGASAQSQSPARRGDALALCHSRVARMTVSIMDQVQKKVVFRGVSEDQFCDEPDAAKLHFLASVALRGIGNEIPNP